MGLSKIFSSQQDVWQICKPLFTNSDINVFSYAKIYPNNSLSLLTTIPDLYSEAVEKGVIFTTKQLKELASVNRSIYDIPGTFYYLTKENGGQEAMSICDKYSLKNGIIFVFKEKGFYECFCFCAQKKEQIIQSHFGNSDILLKFKYYFRDKAVGLIEDADKTRIYLPNNDYNVREQHAPMPLNKERLNSQLDIDYYNVYVGKRKVRITLREFECLKGLASGRKSKEIARKLNISHRTVDGYYLRLREKLGVHNSSALIDFYLRSDLSLLNKASLLDARKASNPSSDSNEMYTEEP